MNFVIKTLHAVRNDLLEQSKNVRINTVKAELKNI